MHVNESNSYIPSNSIQTITINDESILLGTNYGFYVAKFDYDSLKFYNEVFLNHNDGLLSEKISSIKTLNDKIFIGTENAGISSIDKWDLLHTQYYVSDITFTNLATKETISSDSVEMSYSEKGAEIEFHTAALKYHDEISYQYRLHPFHKEWRITTNNIIQYTNIPPGNYNFQIEVIDRRPNTVSEVRIINVHIKPLVWQTLWFKLLIGLILIGLMGLAFYKYYRYRINKTKTRFEQQKLIAKSKLETLKAQIKPHFVFNSLNAIQDYIYTNNDDDVANLLQSFASLIRKGIHLANNDFIAIREEVSFLKNYLELEKIKCENCFDYNIKIGDDLHNIQTPSLVIQPFVENAIVHGIHSVKNKKAFLEISYYSSKNDVICTVKDNGIGIKKSFEKRHKNHNSIGMSISQNRTNYFKAGLGVDVEINIKDISDIEDATGTLVMVTIKNGMKLK